MLHYNALRSACALISGKKTPPEVRKAGQNAKYCNWFAIRILRRASHTTILGVFMGSMYVVHRRSIYRYFKFNTIDLHYRLACTDLEAMKNSKSYWMNGSVVAAGGRKAPSTSVPQSVPHTARGVPGSG